jgi:hypothetical protein
MRVGRIVPASHVWNALTLKRDSRRPTAVSGGFLRPFHPTDAPMMIEGGPLRQFYPVIDFTPTWKERT